MKNTEAVQLVSQTFTHAFSEEQFVGFVRNLLPGLNAPSSKTVPNAQIPQGFREHVHSYTRLGTYHDPQGNVLDVVIVKLKRQGSLDRARTRQRNLMAHYLNKRGIDAVLVAYVADDLADWRFSYVKLAYQTEITDKGKVKVKSEFTPARRYSFLVGENEPNHTAQKQLGDLLMQKGKLTLAHVEEAFNIESVTKKFFEDYKDLFLQIKENLDQIVDTDSQVKCEFERREIDTANFTKKLLGQIVFLYFLQKKGWLGVAKDEAWGLGDRRFLHNLFLENRDKNYFDDVLEPFFYEALAIERKGDFYPALQCKIPFLNGGLFEPMNGYDWENTNINLSNRVFEKIFKVFNLYNFTVREDEPLEREVAVDPEMLGKVFENLL
ncbi:class I SAM-dependent DNA methyltransferase, partial [Candidatus Bathyarchaeota archaeon]|nr:class I SAM-dependent DNA methyltransferase [Candidatus Bathyarchaeota archaeon]